MVGKQHNLGRSLFWAAVFAAIAAVTVYTVLLIAQDRILVSYQGDEGARIYDAGQIAHGYPGSLYGDLQGTLAHTLLGFHPPGDVALRASLIQFTDYLGTIEIPARHLLFAFSAMLGAVTMLVATIIAYRSAGIVGGVLALALLNASYVVVETRSTSMAEASFIPLLLTSLLLATEARRRSGRVSLALVGLSAVLYLACTFMRPEGLFMLPGLCLCLWYLIGFWRATFFGAIAGSFEMAKLLNSVLNAKSVGLTMFNVGELYHNPTYSLVGLLRSDFARQLLNDPGSLLLAIGSLASVAFLFSGRSRHHLFAWRSHLLLVCSALSYLLVVFASEMTGLAPHASYRLAIVPVHLLIPAWAIAVPHVAATYFAPQALALLDRRSRTQLAWFRTGALVLLCGWAAYQFLAVHVPALEKRQPAGLNQAMTFALGRMERDASFFPDRMRYWESALIGYAADRSAPSCYYARCNIMDQRTSAVWREKHPGPQNAEDYSYAEYNALRMHLFIAEERPQYILTAAKPLWESWLQVTKRIWPEAQMLQSSFIYPYMVEPFDFENPQETIFVQLGTINGVSYFEDYVMLIPRTITPSVVVFQAYYGRRPPTAEGTTASGGS